MGTTVLVMQPDGTLKGVGLSLPVIQPVTKFSDANPPYLVPAGKSLRDDMPAGVPVYNVTTFTSSRDIGTCLDAVAAAVNTPGYAYFPGGAPWIITTLRKYGTNDWRGWANADKKIMGWIGDGAQKDGTGTYFDEGDNMIPSDARAWALAPGDTTIGVQLQNLYLSNNLSSIPVFISGIRFRGKLQGPFGVPSGSGLSVNTSVASPIPHRGVAIWRAIAGARIQYCAFEGFGFGLKESPPWELACLESNYDNGLVIYRTEISGKTMNGELASSAYMPSYTSKLTLQDVWIHDTRRSGLALHEHGANSSTPQEKGTYLFDNVQVENIAEAADGYAGSALNRFPSMNIEEIAGTITVKNSRFEAGGGYHLTLATTDGGQLAQRIQVDDSSSLSNGYNGCLIVRVIKSPNSFGSGINPYWTMLTNNGIGSLPLFFNTKGVPLTPVASTAYNAAIHKPDKYFIVVTS